MFACLSLLSKCCPKSCSLEEHTSRTTCCRITQLAITIIFNVTLGGGSFAAIFFTTHLLIPAIIAPVIVVVLLTIVDGTLTTCCMCIFHFKKKASEEKKERARKNEDEIELGKQQEAKRQAQLWDECELEVTSRFNGHPPIVTPWSIEQWMWVYNKLALLEKQNADGNSPLKHALELSAGCLPDQCKMPDSYAIFSFDCSHHMLSIQIDAVPVRRQGIMFDDFLTITQYFIESSKETFLLEKMEEGVEQKQIHMKDLQISRSKEHHDLLNLMIV